MNEKSRTELQTTFTTETSLCPPMNVENDGTPQEERRLQDPGVGPTKAAIRRGMGLSDSCRFCRGHDEKSRPYICEECWVQFRLVIEEMMDAETE